MSTGRSSQKDLVLFSPRNCYKHSGKLKTVKDIFKYPSPTLGNLKTAHGRDWVIAYIALWLVDLNDNAQVKNKMNHDQIEFLAERIYETYSLKITDLTLFFRNVKEGVYGSYYENLSQEKIMSWLKEYFDLRCESAELQQQQKHDKFSLSKDKLNPEVAEKMFEGVGEEKIEHDHEKNGIGSRAKNILSQKLGAEKVEKFQKVKAMSNQDLKKHLANADVNANNFDKYFYEIVKVEIDFRNKNKIEK